MPLYRQSAKLQHARSPPVNPKAFQHRAECRQPRRPLAAGKHVSTSIRWRAAGAGDQPPKHPLNLLGMVILGFSLKNCPGPLVFQPLSVSRRGVYDHESQARRGTQQSFTV